MTELLSRKGTDHLSQANSSMRKALFQTSNHPLKGICLSVTFFDVHLLLSFILSPSVLMWWWWCTQLESPGYLLVGVLIGFISGKIIYNLWRFL